MKLPVALISGEKNPNKVVVLEDKEVLTPQSSRMYGREGAVRINWESEPPGGESVV
jgi:hypothetical protein